MGTLRISPSGPKAVIHPAFPVLVGAMQATDTTNFFPTDGPNTFQSVDGNAFAFLGNGFTLVPAGGVLIYTGPIGGRCLVTLGLTVERDSANVPEAAIGISYNGDLDGLTIPAASTLGEGIGFANTSVDANLVYNWSGAQRYLVLSPGDTIKAVGANGLADTVLFLPQCTISVVVFPP